MTVEEIKHLGMLSRLTLTDQEALAFSEEIDAILNYVSTVSAIAGDGVLQKSLGVVHNVFRDDEVTVEPKSFTDILLNSAPKREGNFVQVRKILEQGE